MYKYYILLLAIFFTTGCSNSDKDTIISNHSDAIFDFYIKHKIREYHVKELLKKAEDESKTMNENLRFNGAGIIARMNGDAGLRRAVCEAATLERNKLLEANVLESITKFNSDTLFLNPLYSSIKSECNTSYILISPHESIDDKITQYNIDFHELKFMAVKKENEKEFKLISLQHEKEEIATEWNRNGFKIIKRTKEITPEEVPLEKNITNSSDNPTTSSENTSKSNDKAPQAKEESIDGKSIIIDSDGYVNLRKEPNSKSEIASTINSGERIIIRSKFDILPEDSEGKYPIKVKGGNGWAEVQSIEGYIGYIHESRIFIVP